MAKRRRNEPVGLISTGSTLLNLACSDKASGAFPLGSMVNIIGDSQAGKSLLALTVMAEAINTSEFEDYLFFYDDVEAALRFNIPKLFGRRLADAIQGPKGGSLGEENRSNEIEEFYYTLDDLLDAKKPFLYVLDSMDALTSKEEQARFDESKKAYRAGKESPGSMGMAIAKINSTHLRQIMGRLRNTGSLLIIISQTRKTIGLSFAPKTRSGGDALRFYACHEMWLAKKKTLDNGIIARIKVSKNKQTGRQGEIEFPILTSCGIDDISSCIDYLIEKGTWQKEGRIVKTGDFGFEGSESKLRVWIEESDKYQELKDLCESCWQDVIEASSVGWRHRYE
jgi:RecA/RadA recombinase